MLSRHIVQGRQTFWPASQREVWPESSKKRCNRKSFAGCGTTGPAYGGMGGAKFAMYILVDDARLYLWIVYKVKTAYTR